MATSTYTQVNDKVKSFVPEIRKAAEEYRISEYVELIKAVMMAKSKGKGTDPMGVGAKNVNISGKH